LLSLLFYDMQYKTIASRFISFGQAFAAYLIAFVQTQLMLTIVSLPFLVFWGFGISTMSLIGNLLFTPVLGFFLLLCTVLFFACLLQLPHEPIVQCLNILTEQWHYMLGYGSKTWITYCAQPPIVILFSPIILLIAALVHPKINSPFKRIGCMMGILALFFCYTLMQQKKVVENTSTIFLDKKLYGIMRADKKLILIDEGYAAQKKSPEKALEYNILPALFKAYGSVHIAEYVIRKPMRSSMKIAATLCKRVPVDQVCLPYFDTPEKKAVWWAYFDLKRTMASEKVALVRYSKNAAHWWRYRLRKRCRSSIQLAKR
jgi:hypothetical protein